MTLLLSILKVNAYLGAIIPFWRQIEKGPCFARNIPATNKVNLVQQKESIFTALAKSHQAALF